MCEESVTDWLQTQSICVTGGRGALGTRLVRRLLAGGAARVVTLDRRQPVGLRELATQGQPIEQIVGSILNPSDLDRAFEGCTTVFHLAALAHAGRSFLTPFDYFEVNALGTAQVMEACRRSGITRVIYTSTGHVYGIPQQVPVDEDHRTVPLSVYAASKLAGETAVLAYGTNFGLACDIARLSNVYGLSFNEETVIGAALLQAVVSGPIVLRDLTAVRDFIHADDVIEALVWLAASSDGHEGGNIFNVSTGRGVSILEMAEILAKMVAEQRGGKVMAVQAGESQKIRIPKLILNNRRLSRRTGWRPKICLEKGLELALQEFQAQQ